MSPPGVRNGLETIKQLKNGSKKYGITLFLLITAASVLMKAIGREIPQNIERSSRLLNLLVKGLLVIAKDLLQFIH